MEVELGLKITKTRDDITSVSDFHFAKDRAGPLFLSKETDSKFILTGHLKGYKNENIDIKISEDGRVISISGEKAVEEMVMIPFKKEVKIRGFRKKLKIPRGVDLDKIKANYNEKESVMTILMPKTVKGIRGVKVEEVIEEETDKGKPEMEQQSVADQVPEKSAEQTIPVEKRGPRKPKKPCPCPPLLIAGSTLIASLIFLIIHCITEKKR
ncbi:hypothetical protein L6164_007184 [Bauhinia variegata]|uniref:Uncharacterized protein n=1 Tax=Bauhinia variegata TaxID=167791 RepID=A0ACB9PWW6_BAUVA|nr:hypothetical protein L6164_007184 [Bauhinia variegata]